jgi:glycosyltransferase involved in cell wall biosynthesis
MKITFCCIVFNGDFVLKQLLESVYPFAYKIIIVDGVVEYWAKRGFVGSEDETKQIIRNFSDPEGKIVPYYNHIRKEKTELCQIFMGSVPNDTDYIWCIDADEIFKPEEIEKAIKILEEKKPGSVGVKSNTFFGGFDYILNGFEAEHDFKRILKYKKGATYLTHRPPTLSSEEGGHIRQAIEMYHYSYVSPAQVKQKIEYYKNSLSKDNCIDNYFEDVWLKWVLHPEQRQEIEDKYNGVHEFIPSYRGECRTEKFTGKHPTIIERDILELIIKCGNQLYEQSKDLAL